MTIDTYLNHKREVRFLALFLTVLIVISCMSVPADAAALEIGISLIALILSGFGVVASTTGTIDGMNQGLESLMGEFSESQGKETGWFRGLFNTDNITSKGYNRLGVGGALVAGIKLFVEWLRADKGLSTDEPLDFGQTESTITVNGITYPVKTDIPYRFNGRKIYTDYSYGDVGYSYHFMFGQETSGYHDLIQPYRYWIYYESYSSYDDISVRIYKGDIQITYNDKSINGPPKQDFIPVVYLIFMVVNGYLVPFLSYPIYDSGSNKVVTSDYRYIPNYGDYTDCLYVGNTSIAEPGDVWQVEDDNIDTDYLDQEDGSTKDVIFTPAFPADMPLDDLDLGTIGGMEDAAGRAYDYSQSETGTAVGQGEISTDTNLQPGDNEVPDIYIPSGGFFSTIWHYVVEALQVSKDGISFILNVVNTVIPPSILTLCLASCVLLIVFGILNKFLK